VRELTLLEAVREALQEELERDPRVLVFGEDVGRLGGVFRATEGLQSRFGTDRVVDTPMAELSIAGLAVGLAMRGLRPVAEIQFADFIHAAADHLVGEAAKIRYRTAGDWTCPLVLRTAYGGGFRGGPYHSQSVEAFYAHVPGLKVVAPAFPADAKGLLTASIRDPDPVLFLEHKLTYRRVRGPVPEGEHLEEIGRARVVRTGDQVTICAYGMMLHESLAAAEALAAEGVEAEVLDLRTLLPLDRDAILASVRRTGRLCVVHEDTLTMGLGAEVAALVCEAAFEELKAPPVRVAMADIGGIPVSDPLEDAAIPDRHRLCAAWPAAAPGAVDPRRRRLTTRQSRPRRRCWRWLCQPSTWSGCWPRWSRPAAASPPAMPSSPGTESACTRRSGSTSTWGPTPPPGAAAPSRSSTTGPGPRSSACLRSGRGRPPRSGWAPSARAAPGWR